MDGALISAPEQGEGGNSNVYYEPLVESMQEVKVENNSFSAEFGNNGGTVVNMVMKSGTNAFHGTAGISCSVRRWTPVISSIPRPTPSQMKRDQGGFSIGGPIIKNKTFFFADFEKVRSTPSDQQARYRANIGRDECGDFSATARPTAQSNL